MAGPKVMQSMQFVIARASWSLAWAALVFFVQTNASIAADQLVLRFLSDPQTSNSVVRLKDIVEIVSGSTPALEKLKETSLGPAPREGQVQNWSSEEVLEHLELRGLDRQSIRWSGSNNTKLQGVKVLSTQVKDSITPAFVDDRIIATAKNNVAAAIREYLNLKAGSQVDWRVEAQVAAQHAKLLQSRRNILSIGGGSEPWTGQQEFVFQLRQNGQTMTLTILAEVNTPPLIVVASGPIRRDQILTIDQLSYAPLPKNAEDVGYFTEIKSVVGKQLRRSISTNQAITRDVVSDPIVIQRNQLVEVESVSGSIVVKTSGKSLGSGAVGDLIDIEMQDRKKLKATVVGTGLARIAATSAVTNSR